MQTHSHSPSFNVSLRGYDREEVDEYLDSLAEALDHIEEAEAQNTRLQNHINRMNLRIKELENQLMDCAPRSGVVVGDRVGSILREAEEAAGEIVRAASEKAAEADGLVSSAVARGEEEARKIVASARADAHEIVTEAEGRATARTRQIEQWAEQVISHARAEEARMLRDQQERRAAAALELETLAEQRRGAASTLTALWETLGGALGLVESPEPADGAPSSSSSLQESSDSHADSPGLDASGDSSGHDSSGDSSGPATGRTPVVSGAEPASGSGSASHSGSAPAAGAASHSGSAPATGAPARGAGAASAPAVDLDDESEDELEGWVSQAGAHQET
jgi:DivIVA domain-containing protein